MKQVLLRKGKLAVQEVPQPALPAKNALVEVSYSLISTGTEMASVNLSGASLITKAKERPQEVAKVLNSIKVRGLKKTLALVQGKLDEWKPLGYSCAGRVIVVGAAVASVRVGDVVACAGAGLANHAEVVSVPETLAAKVPAGVPPAHASFVTLGAIALQGVRRADVRLGETVCVVGLGLIGQITVQLLAAAGCRVIGLDLDKSRVDLALANGLHAGATDNSSLKNIVDQATQGQGADATLLTASTSSSEPTRLAFELTRKKGKVVVVGSVGMDLQRSPFYEKEQDFLISCSYGPGRYDPTYEAEAHDYPYAYVRWTENRNMTAFLDLLDQKKLDVGPLIGQTFPLDQATQAYDLLNQDGPKPLAVVLSYGLNGHKKQTTTSVVAPGFSSKSVVRVGLIGAGNFVQTTHIPNLKALASMAKIEGVCTANSATAFSIGKQVGASVIATDYHELLKNAAIDAVIISTRHNKHAAMAIDALNAGKHVFLEKPLALEASEIEALEKTVAASTAPTVLMVGFNRRFAPMTVAVKKALAGRQAPLQGLFRVNAGSLPAGHWIHSAEGGGRLRGEACHMVDFFRSLVGAPLRELSVSAISGPRPDENFSAEFVYEDGSLCTLLYTAVGHTDLVKEIVEIHWMGKTALIEDFKKLTFFGKAGGHRSSAQDKGHRAALETFFKSIQTGVRFPIPWDELLETSRAVVDLDGELWGRIRQ